MTPAHEVVVGGPCERVGGPFETPPLDGVPCCPKVHLARPSVIPLEGVPGIPPEYVGLGVVPLDGGGGDAGPRFAGLPGHLGGALLTPPL